MINIIMTLVRDRHHQVQLPFCELTICTHTSTRVGVTRVLSEHLARINITHNTHVYRTESLKTGAV